MLIVEDNKELRKYLYNVLSKIYPTYTAEDGNTALKIMKNETINLVISDIVMPVMDGLELCQRIKSNPELCHIPILILTARTELSDKIDSLEHGADIYLEKPFSIDYLLAQVANIFENREKICQKYITSPDILFANITNNKSDEVFLKKLNECIEENLSDSDFTVQKLATLMLTSKSSLNRKIKGILGLSPNDFIRVYRLKKAAELLRKNEYRINEICYLVGFNSPSYFAKCFQKQFGVLPKHFE